MGVRPDSEGTSESRERKREREEERKKEREKANVLMTFEAFLQTVFKFLSHAINLVKF
jgi:hypothetical protein